MTTPGNRMLLRIGRIGSASAGNGTASPPAGAVLVLVGRAGSGLSASVESRSSGEVFVMIDRVDSVEC
jgi:hypothetical protein